MSINSYIFTQIKAQLQAIQKKHPNERIIAIRIENGLDKVSEIRVDGRIYKVCFCDSSLQVRESLVNFNGSADSLVIITKLDINELEHDIVARLARRKVFQLDPWGILLEIFQARDVSPRLLKQKWMAELLLTEIPAEGYPTTPSGVLDEETVWRIVLVDKFGMRSARPDINDLLIWSLENEKLEIFTSYPEPVQIGTQEWIKKSAGEISRLFFASVKSGFGHLMTALGLVCEVISSGQEIPEVNQSSVRLERYFSNQPLSDRSLMELAKAAASTVNYLQEARTGLVHKIYGQSEEILKEIHISSFAHLSSILPAGLEARLENYGRELIEVTQAKTIKQSANLREYFQKILHHQLAIQNEERREKVEMSFRLLRWLVSDPQTEFDSFGAASKLYVQEISYVDWARNIILHGDTNPTFSNGLTALQKFVTLKREEQNKSFGQLITNWTEAGATGDEVWRVEEIIEEVVAKIATQKLVLFIVMDGMNFAVFHEIKKDLKLSGWRSFTSKSDDIKPVIAALPSVTSVSRTSLLCGKLLKGNSSTEVKGFAKNQSLAALSKTGFPPKIFHKASIADGVGASLTKEITDALYSENQKVVGVVVNSIDDHLAKGEQIAVSWNLKSIPLLNKLLIAATETDRIVIITSDHGHVIEQDAEFHKGDFAGERYREANDEPKTGELVVTGNRVLGDTGNKIIAPWSETIRYAKKKHGYHGGISPQECLIPLAVLSKSPEVLKNWRFRDESECGWWNLNDDGSTKNNHSDNSRFNKKQIVEEFNFLPLFS